jgi:hypothetical protein
MEAIGWRTLNLALLPWLAAAAAALAWLAVRRRAGGAVLGTP